MLTHPTTAGVMASYASVGDLIIAEPGAMIGFAGPRVIKDTTQAELPPGFQTAEFLLDHGLIDAIVPAQGNEAAACRISELPEERAAENLRSPNARQSRISSEAVRRTRGVADQVTMGVSVSLRVAISALLNLSSPAPMKGIILAGALARGCSR